MFVWNAQVMVLCILAWFQAYINADMPKLLQECLADTNSSALPECIANNSALPSHFLVSIHSLLPILLSIGLHLENKVRSKQHAF